MPRLEKPEDAEDLLAGITVALLITAIISLPIVGGAMWLLLDAPTWSLAVAVAVIFALMVYVVFSPEVEDADDAEPDNLRWRRAERPRGVVGWAKRIATIWLTWAGMCVIVNLLVLELVFGAGDTAKGISAILLLPLAILSETYDLEEDDADAQSSPVSEP